MNLYYRETTLDIESTVAALREAFELRRRRSMIAGHEVNTDSMRLRTFAYKGTSCIACGTKALFFALERGAHTPEGSRLHLNLWGTDAAGEPLLFTQDHTLARANGGLDVLENSETMCSPCNWSKGSDPAPSAS